MVKLPFILFFILVSFIALAQNIPSHKIIPNDQLSEYLSTNTKQQLSINGGISSQKLAEFYRTAFSERYFYNWQEFDSRFLQYKNWYPYKESSHTAGALDHLNKYPDSTHWKLPFNYKNGDPVNAYALRHLARQHKMVDIALYTNYMGNDTNYVEYFVNQVASLNAALVNNNYEKIEDGNGVYEAFRAGYRVLNWLQIHNMFLADKTYTNENQLTTIATLLQHGALLFKTNQKFKSGNHQTRGLSALAMLSIIFRDFEGTQLWYDHSMALLEEHLNKEINADGFQFERSVHYHISDIANYYYVYRLAQISNLEINESWENKLKSLFTTLIYIAYPDNTAPVLQDDTDIPWAEKNYISQTLTLGYLLFEDAEMGYFAGTAVEPKMYWYLNAKQLNLLKNIEKKVPSTLSYSFPNTGYYIMRQGWQTNNNMMIISCGVDDKKPDHQHGDILGIQAMANTNVILPNYQVRYPLSDLELFKNSMVKNVALVDNELQGKQWKGNKGGSGFGKFKELPEPNVILWEANSANEIFIGSHNGFSNIDVDYSRQIINVNDDFWLVKDNFTSADQHNYKQIWQGHYSLENQPNLLRSSFSNGTGCDIYQLQGIDTVNVSGARGKQWSIASKTKTGSFSFITTIYPFSHYSERINEQDINPQLKDWKVNAPIYKATGAELCTLSNETQSYAFNLDNFEFNGIEIQCSNPADLLISFNASSLTVKTISDKEISITITGASKISQKGKTAKSELNLLPGEYISLSFK